MESAHKKIVNYDRCCVKYCNSRAAKDVINVRFHYFLKPNLHFVYKKNVCQIGENKPFKGVANCFIKHIIQN